uniref:Uncharacterized protein n=1 Tax=Cryptomonas curvata TaxID=233186 RepID=A0A7S0M9E2_9CRYP|mmetsp:Transcript_2738/g.5869  ORF Transcript_2738/g.5869 Transcript_2738/m.5869 type:complete len:207 (+) Transcript_2738:33-653(+)|eukprot:CAMPEP_0172174934 /NCGR_PEP_ID=MMETSP1050-20130122/13941_1 /TAXON_ID=233186 /ORGANISM="Cryptomonas curvata, Strain CCAP979/52" /LENGTH=206 /DNA_ID=CAMNT_0012846967 /DNA_START=33 /DNA_END=653 /DNA_ORIENTATION=-
MEFIPEWPFVRFKEQINGEDKNVLDSMPWNSSFNGEGNAYFSSDQQPRNASAIKTFDPTIIVDEKPEETLNARWQAKVAGAIGRLKEEKPEVEKRLSTLQQLSGETPVAWSHVLRRWNKTHDRPQTKTDASAQDHYNEQSKEETETVMPHKPDSASAQSERAKEIHGIKNRLKAAQEAAFDVHRKMGKDSDLFVSYAVARRRAMLG